MIKRLIKNIRRQPKHTRDKIALGVAGSFTAVIFAVWVYNVPARLSAISQEHEKDTAPVFSQLFDQIGSQLSSVKEAVSETGNATTSKVEAESKRQFESTLTATSSYIASSSKPVTVSTTATTTATFSQLKNPNSNSTTTPRTIRLVPESQATSSVRTE